MKIKLNETVPGSVLTPIKFMGMDKFGAAICVFRCICGNEKSRTLSNVLQSIKRSQTTSCGCLRKENARKHIEKVRFRTPKGWRKGSRPWSKGKKNTHIPWNKGLTTEEIRIHLWEKKNGSIKEYLKSLCDEDGLSGEAVQTAEGLHRQHEG